MMLTAHSLRSAYPIRCQLVGATDIREPKDTIREMTLKGWEYPRIAHSSMPAPRVDAGLIEMR
jgi:hypothetical protein